MDGALGPTPGDPGCRARDGLWLARVQDASAWALIAVALVLAPWSDLYDLLGLPAPDPPGPWQAGGAVLALATIALLVSRSRGAVGAAALADLAGAIAVTAWLVAGAGLETKGTIVAIAVAVSLLIQALFDAAVLAVGRRRGP